MTERLALGITIGASNSVAVATRGNISNGDDGPAGSGTVFTHPSVLRLAADTAPAFGTDARSTGRHSSDVVLEGFLARVGDPVGILAEDGTSHSAADLMATAITCLIDEINSAATQDNSATVACHPAWWSRHTVDMQRAALDRADLREVTLVPEPTAAVRWLEAAHGPLGDGIVAVYDLGATGLTVSVVRTGEQAALLGTPVRSTDVAGAEFDLLTMRYVLANALQGNEFDPFDPVIERELAALRDRCRYAKEELSINTATVVPVRLDPSDRRTDNIRLVRGEVEDLLRGPLLTSIDLIRDAVHRAGLEIGDIGRVLLTGGGGAIPLVAELISTEFGLPVVAAPEPGHTSARGAAVLAADLLAATVDHAPLAIPATIAAVAPAKTKELPAVSRQDKSPPKAATLPGSRIRKLTGRQRAAVVAGAAVVIGLLATGTVAIGTGAQSEPNHPASTEQTTTGAAEAATGAGTGNAPAPGSAVPVADPTVGANAKPEAGQPVSASSGATSAAVNSQPAPGQPAANQQAPGQPAPANPAPAEPGAAQPVPQSPAPAPGPSAPPAQSPPAQSPPAQPSLPTDALNNTVDKVEGAVEGTLGPILRAPGQILGGSDG
ncbi:Hsp70 family protein [Nocardia sp. GCM10030253]|uniref:Hsp70 family protein n=1 Tax=Nocardia sp. GCM10030253 TaxID=3273404 RepID=UPI003633708B